MSPLQCIRSQARKVNGRVSQALEPYLLKKILICSLKLKKKIQTKPKQNKTKQKNKEKPTITNVKLSGIATGSYIHIYTLNNIQRDKICL